MAAAKPERLDDVRAEHSTREAAAVAVRRRFEKVGKRLKQVKKSAGRDARAVHKLRTACRRAGAALDAFGPCLPEKRVKKAKKLLKQTRKAAGDARDLDVQAKLWRRLGNEEPAAADAAAVMLRRGRKKRKEARTSLLKSIDGLKPRDAKKAGGTLAKKADHARVDGRGVERMGVFARETLEAMSADLRARIEGGPLGPERLHEARIAEKRLRYAVELLAPGLDGGVSAQLKEDLKALHDRLGRQHDLYVARGLLDRLESKGKMPAEVTEPLRGVVDDRLLEAHRAAVAELTRFGELWLRATPWGCAATAADPDAVLADGPAAGAA